MSSSMQWAHEQRTARNGFTIAELLVVIVVIVILAAVSLVAYNGITERARALEVTNSLKIAVDEVRAGALDNPSPTALPSNLKIDKNVVLQLAGSKAGSKEFCINAYRVEPLEMKSYDSANREIKPYLCAGPLIGSPVGGTIPAVPTGVNLVADFSQWTLTGGATYNSTTGEIEFSGTSGKATSPLVRAVGSTSMALRYELFSATSAPNQSPNAGTYSGSAYFGSDGVTPAYNSINYTTNGNAQSVPLNAWTSRNWTTSTGPNVHYIQFNINLAPTTWTSNNFKVRNPSVMR